MSEYQTSPALEVVTFRWELIIRIPDHSNAGHILSKYLFMPKMVKLGGIFEPNH
jgi:hypothetical protein